MVLCFINNLYALLLICNRNIASGYKLCIHFLMPLISKYEEDYSNSIVSMRYLKRDWKVSNSVFIVQNASILLYENKANTNK